jgi:hypothetical protein
MVTIELGYLIMMVTIELGSNNIILLGYLIMMVTIELGYLIMMVTVELGYLLVICIYCDDGDLSACYTNTYNVFSVLKYNSNLFEFDIRICHSQRSYQFS